MAASSEPSAGPSGVHQAQDGKSIGVERLGERVQLAVPRAIYGCSLLAVGQSPKQAPRSVEPAEESNDEEWCDGKEDELCTQHHAGEHPNEPLLYKLLSCSGAVLSSRRVIRGGRCAPEPLPG